VTRILAWFI